MSIQCQKRPFVVFTLSLVVIILSACTAPEKFKADYWPTPMAKDDYPEQQDTNISNRSSFGVAFQGGGNRAAPAALGQLRALHELKWIDKVQYISAVSGGAWAAIPYTYLKETYDEGTFLGTYAKPDIVAQRLPKMIEGDLSPEFEDGSMLGAMKDSSIFINYLIALASLRMDEAYSEALSKIYLKPFGLGRNQRGDPDSLFTWRRDDRDEIRKSSARFANTEIHYVERKRPYLIVGGSVLAKRINPGPKEKFLMEMTPLYTGVPWKVGPKLEHEAKLPMGGGYIESYGYDYITDGVEGGDKKKTLTLRDPIIGNLTDRSRLNFSLSNMAAVSGAAPVETIISLPLLNLLFSNMGFPEHYIPTDTVVPKDLGWFTKEGELYEKEWAHGDGGHEDNLGLVSLLERRVENIIVFANSYAPLGKYPNIKDKKDPDNKKSMIDLCEEGLKDQENKLPEMGKLSPELEKCLEMAGDDLPTFFVQTEKSIHNAGLILKENTKLPKDKQKLRGYYDLLAIALELKKDLISCRQYDYTSQLDKSRGKAPTHSYSPKICIIFLGMDEEWKQSIKETTKTKKMTDPQVQQIQEALDLKEDWKPAITKVKLLGTNGFPHLGTFFDQEFRVIKTKPARLYALSNFVAWKLKKHNQQISEFFDDLDLPVVNAGVKTHHWPE